MLVKLLSNCNRNFQGQPSGQNRQLLQLCISTRVLHVFPTKPKNRYNQLSPNIYPLLYGSLFSIFVLFRNHFDALSFEFEIDHDNGTVTGILSHSEATKEQYNKNDLSSINIAQTAVSLLFVFVVSFDLFCSQKC